MCSGPRPQQPPNIVTPCWRQTRVFSTRELSKNELVSYTIAVEVVRDGKSFTATEKVNVKGGETTSLTIAPAMAVASK